jgi:hypothetical protein
MARLSNAIGLVVLYGSNGCWFGREGEGVISGDGGASGVWMGYEQVVRIWVFWKHSYKIKLLHKAR